MTKISVVDDRQHVTVNGYYSSTYDVLAIVGDEEDARIEVIASFDSCVNAEKFTRSTDDTRYIVAVRPPNDVVREVVAWIAAVTSNVLETIERR